MTALKSRQLTPLKDKQSSPLLPDHLAIIMDGNGRWAIKHGKQRLAGHQKGAQTVHSIVRECVDLGINYLTLYAFSSENWNRSDDEVKSLMSLLGSYLASELQLFSEKNVRLNLIGDIDRLPVDVQSQLKKNLAHTANNSGLVLTLALSYGGRDELKRAIRSIAEKAKDNNLELHQITEQLISAHLDTAGIPDPDLLIRTSGEQRISNFLLWQLSYTELYFTPLLWPEFDTPALYEALEEYQARCRRFGTRP